MLPDRDVLPLRQRPRWLGLTRPSRAPRDCKAHSMREALHVSLLGHTHETKGCKDGKIIVGPDKKHKTRRSRNFPTDLPFYSLCLCPVFDHSISLLFLLTAKLKSFSFRFLVLSFCDGREIPVPKSFPHAKLNVASGIGTREPTLMRESSQPFNIDRGVSWLLKPASPPQTLWADSSDRTERGFRPLNITFHHN